MHLHPMVGGVPERHDPGAGLRLHEVRAPERQARVMVRVAHTAVVRQQRLPEHTVVELQPAQIVAVVQPRQTAARRGRQRRDSAHIGDRLIRVEHASRIKLEFGEVHAGRFLLDPGVDPDPGQRRAQGGRRATQSLPEDALGNRLPWLRQVREQLPQAVLPDQPGQQWIRRIGLELPDRVHRQCQPGKRVGRKG